MANSGLSSRRPATWAAAVLFVAASAGPSLGQSTWNTPGPGTFQWNAASNWSGGLPTSSATTALIFSSATAQTTSFTANNDFAAPFLLNSLTFNHTAGTTVTITGNALNFTGAAPALTISGAGSLIISAPLTLSSTDATPNVTLGGAGTGAVTLSGLISGGLNNLVKTTSGTLTISGGGTMNRLSLRNGNTIISGGTLALTQPNGENPENGGGVDLNGLSGLQLGNATGQVVTATISGGATVNVTENVYIGDIAGSTGTLTVTGAGTVLNALGGASNRFGVGNNGTGTLNILAGAVVNTQSVFASRFPGSSNTILIDGPGSLLNATTQLAISSNGLGNTTVSNGGRIQAPATFRSGANPAGNGTLTVTGSGTTLVAAATFVMGSAAGSGPFVTDVLNGAAVTIGTQTQLLNGNNTLNIGTGATYTNTGAFFLVPAVAGNVATVNVTGASTVLNLVTNIAVNGTNSAGGGTASLGTSILNVGNGGTINVTTGFLTPYANGTVNLNAGGFLNVGALLDGIAGTSFGTVNIAAGRTLNLVGGGDATFTGIIAGAGGISKAGTTNQTLGGANTFSGGTTVTAGTLTITSATALGSGPVAVATGATIAGAIPLTVPANATLSGAGTIGTAVNVGPNATIRGGALGTTDTLAVTGNVTLTTGATGAGSQRTQVTVSNTAASLVAVTGIVNFVDPAGANDPFVLNILSLGLTPNVSVTRTVMTASGGFQSNGAGPIPAGTNFTLGTDYIINSPTFGSFTGVTLGIQGANNNLLVVTFTPVPEPATVLGIAAAAGVLFRLRRRFV